MGLVRHDIIKLRQNVGEVATLLTIMGIDANALKTINAAIKSRSPKDDIDSFYETIRKNIISLKGSDDYNNNIIRNEYRNYIENEVKEVLFPTIGSQLKYEVEIHAISDLIHATYHAEKSMSMNSNSLFSSDMVGLDRASPGKITPSELQSRFSANVSTFKTAFKGITWRVENEDTIQMFSDVSGISKNDLLKSMSIFLNESDYQAIVLGLINAFETSPENLTKIRSEQLKKVITDIIEVGQITIECLKKKKKGIDPFKVISPLDDDFSDFTKEFLKPGTLTNALFAADFGAKTIDVMQQRPEYDKLEVDKVTERANKVAEKITGNELADVVDKEDNSAIDSAEGQI